MPEFISFLKIFAVSDKESPTRTPVLVLLHRGAGLHPSWGVFISLLLATLIKAKAAAPHLHKPISVIIRVC